MVNCGLLTHNNEPVPLKHIEVDLQVQGHVATVTSNLQYVNEEERPLEAVFVFPMPSGAALCHFSVKIADQEIVAEVQEKQEAREQYDDALSSGQQAFLLEGSKQSLDVFRLSVGSLPPHQSAAVTFIYIIELSVQADHSLQFCLPAVLNPRYSPAGTGGGIVSEITSSSAGVPYSLSFTAQVSSPNPIAKVESKCPLEPLTFLNKEHTKAKVSLTAGHKFDRDVELYVYYQNPHQLTAVVEAGAPAAQPGTLMGDPAVMVSFYPEFPESVTSSTSSCGEFVFVMDRSGSMGCVMYNGQHVQQRIMCARDTLLLLLKSLPMGCYFNIYGFGSNFESFFPKSVQYSQDIMDQAVKKINNMQADMGGTSILRPLEHIYKQPCIPNHPRQLFIFTDGEVGNTRDVLHCVRRNADFHRCFSFGIGEGASSALITGLAENGSGHAQFITGTERMQAKVMQSLRFALQPAVTDITEDWTGLSFTRLSPPIKALFPGQRALIYAQLKGEECHKPDAMGKITVQFRIGDLEVSNTVHFSRKPAEDSGLSIHRLGARSLIRSLEREEQDDGADKEALKARVVELSKQSGVSSSHTAFIAVNKGSGQAVKGPLVTRRIPTPITPMGASMASSNWPVMQQRKGMNMSQMLVPQQRQQNTMMQQQQGMNMSQMLVPQQRQQNTMMQQQQGMNMSQMMQQQQGINMSQMLVPQQRQQNTMMQQQQGMNMSQMLVPQQRLQNIMMQQQQGMNMSQMMQQQQGINMSQMLVPQQRLQNISFGSAKLNHCIPHSASKRMKLQLFESQTPEAPKDPLLQLVSLQKASGCWEMEPALAEVFGRTEKELMEQIPVQVKPDFWATLLALIWLHGFKIDAQVEWHFLALKAVAWIRTQKVDKQSECVRIGSAVLGCQVKEDALRI